MDILSIILIGVGLAMDAFAVSITRAMTIKKISSSIALKMAIVFGLFQGVMVILGRFIGGYFYSFIEKYNSYIVFIVFVALGVKMLIECFKKDEDEDEESIKNINFKELMLLGLATSIDALAVGVTFVTYKQGVWIPPVIIGIVTFILVIIAVVLGYFMGKKVESKWAEILGAILLIALGIKALI